SVDTFDIVGTSLGGLLALRLAQRWPERVRRLVLLSSAGLGRGLPWLVRVGTVPGVARWSARPTRSGTRWLFRRYLTTDRSGLDAPRQAALLEYLYRSERAALAGHMARALRAFGGPCGQREVLSDAELSKLRVPALVVWGDGDRFFPVRHARRAVQHLPDARLAIIERAGHSPNWERPEAFASAVLDFLRPRGA
ncbi:MAG TPA: alpha/beta fold hydrolase, partial [Longimicrobiales bacterium]|nr:alpha/beta fold hydrolase [Longimicrobiales bacterium]